MSVAIRIVSDGTSIGTKVTAGGLDVAGVTKATWTIDAETGMSLCTIEVVAASVDVIGEAGQ